MYRTASARLARSRWLSAGTVGAAVGVALADTTRLVGLWVGVGAREVLVR